MNTPEHYDYYAPLSQEELFAELAATEAELAEIQRRIAEYSQQQEQTQEHRLFIVRALGQVILGEEE